MRHTSHGLHDLDVLRTSLHPERPGMPQHVTVVVALEELPARLRPSQCFRHGDITVIFTDPSTPVAEAVEWSVDNLTVEECNYIRAAYQQPPVGHPVADEIMDEPDCYSIPALLRAPRVDLPLAQEA